MATTPGIPGANRRRSDRVLLRVPIRIHGINKENKRVSTKGEAVVVSRHGALLKTDTELKPGSEAEIENSSTQQSARFRVIWTSDRPTEGRWEVGLETTPGAAANIWGLQFPPVR